MCQEASWSGSVGVSGQGCLQALWNGNRDAVQIQGPGCKIPFEHLAMGGRLHCVRPWAPSRAFRRLGNTTNWWAKPAPPSPKPTGRSSTLQHPLGEPFLPSCRPGALTLLPAADRAHRRAGCAAMGSPPPRYRRRRRRRSVQVASLPHLVAPLSTAQLSRHGSGAAAAAGAGGAAGAAHLAAPGAAALAAVPGRRRRLGCDVGGGSNRAAAPSHLPRL